mgnify:CR=1 FL=1
MTRSEKPPPRYVAFFDLDNTILDASSGRLYVQYLFQNGGIGFQELLEGMFVGVVYRLGLLDTEAIIRRWAMKYRGVPEKKIADQVRAWFDNVVVHHFRPSVQDEINRHRANGGRVVILSAASNFVCHLVGGHLDMDDVLCTHLEVVNGRLTGSFNGSYCYGREKLNRALRYCTENGFFLSDAYYYGDSHADEFILSGVGHPVCVAPDWRLKRLAGRNRWPIIFD